MAARKNDTEPLKRTKNTICLSCVCGRSGTGKHNVVINCDDDKFVVTRSKLCKFSKKFRNVAQGVEPNQEWEVNLTGASNHILRSLLEVVQADGDTTLIESLNIEEIIGVMTLAHALEMKSIETELCFLTLKQATSYDVVAALWDFALAYNNEDVINEIIRFTYEHLNDMMTVGFFRTLSWDKVLSLIKPERREFLLDTLCMAIVDWLKSDPVKKIHAPLIARHLPWKNLSTNTICQLVLTDYMFRRLLKYSINNYFWYPPPVVKAAIEQFHQLQQHLSADENGNTFGFKGKDFTKNLCSYLLAWSHNLSLRQLNYHCPSDMKIDEPVLLVLGATRYNSLALQYYFVKSKTWMACADIKMQCRHNFGCTFWQKHLIIVGGDRGDGMLYNQCLKINISGQIMAKNIEELRHPRCHPGVVVRKDQLYIFGGLNETGEAVSVAFTLERTENTFQLWKPIKLMKERRVRPGVAVDSCDQIIVIGGHCCSCEYLSENGWVEMAPLPSSYRDCGMLAVHCNRMVYAFRDFSPTEVCIFDMVRGGLRITPTFGLAPVKISSIYPFGNELWVLTPSGRFFIYFLSSNFWMKTHLKARGLRQSYFAVIIDKADLRPPADQEKNDISQNQAPLSTEVSTE